MGLFDFFRRSPKPSLATAAGGRYAGRPLLILLENYVLSAIGTLAPDKDQLVASITQRIFGGGTDWRTTLRTTLQLGDSLDESLRRMWAENQQQAQQAGVTLSPEEFARMIADQNFAHLLTAASN
ncbi:hypothetical protein [Prosthecobacter sp.]|jgi:hypothetical protein|uniref:hypothetical protein n=1 Tax=Prosthecobacter sp. TaxID=1965333 RepID=UPI0037833D31